MNEEILNENPTMLMGVFSSDEEHKHSEENKIVAKHLQSFQKDFILIGEKIKEINTQRQTTLNRFRVDIPAYISEKLMSLMLSNITKKHEEVYKLNAEEKKNNGYYNADVIVATPLGFRQRSSWGKKTDNLNLRNILLMLSEKPDVFIDWLRDNKLYKKLEAFRELKGAFDSGWKKEWFDFENDDVNISSQVSINKPVFYADVFENNSCSGEKIEIKDIFISEVKCFINQNNNRVNLLFFQSGKKIDKAISWSSFIRMFGFRDFTAEILKILDDVKYKVVEEDKKIVNWWSGMTSKLSKYSALADL